MKNIDIRKITAMAAALVMCLSLSACGGTDSSGTSKGAKKGAKSGSVGTSAAKSDTTEAATTTAAIAEAETTDDAASDMKLKDAKDKSALIGEEFTGETAADMELYAAEERAEAIPDDDIGIIPEDDIPVTNGEAFVLTAGEWNDNDNWGFFTNLAKNNTISFPVFGFDPTHRIAVTVTNDGKPVREQTVELLDSDGNVIWTARSDKDGMAYVFYKADQNPAQVKCGDAVQEVKGGSNDEQGVEGTTEAALETSAENKKPEDTQVMFILDTTGSMGDEIAYLQMDFASIASAVDDGHTTFSANFYRDADDVYVTKCNPFTDDVKSVQSVLNKEHAAGGGDFPEAIAEVLQETITDNSQWSESANKIAFLIFDAPPHDGKEEVLEKAVKTAAAKGIHLVPVVSSGADRDTELFGRAIAAQTNSNYVFLTDDSGVGDSHLEPIIGDYEVELLHDIIVRNITELRD